MLAEVSPPPLGNERPDDTVSLVLGYERLRHIADI